MMMQFSKTRQVRTCPFLQCLLSLTQCLVCADAIALLSRQLAEARAEVTRTHVLAAEQAAESAAAARMHDELRRDLIAAVRERVWPAAAPGGC
jgi:hypothetical protein